MLPAHLSAPKPKLSGMKEPLPVTERLKLSPLALKMMLFRAGGFLSLPALGLRWFSLREKKGSPQGSARSFLLILSSGWNIL